MEFLFENYSTDHRVYNLCQGYFTRLFRHKLGIKVDGKENLIPNQYDFDAKNYDANPIYCYRNPKLGKIVRIILLDSKDIDDNGVDIKEVSIAAWTDTFQYYENEYRELVISAILTKDTVTIMTSLIKEWLKNDEKDGFDNLIRNTISKQQD